jgi:hypothetical protein
MCKPTVSFSTNIVYPIHIIHIPVNNSPFRMEIDTKKREFSFPIGKRMSMFKTVIWLPAFYPTVK